MVNKVRVVTRTGAGEAVQVRSGPVYSRNTERQFVGFKKDGIFFSSSF